MAGGVGWIGWWVGGGWVMLERDAGGVGVGWTEGWVGWGGDGMVWPPNVLDLLLPAEALRERLGFDPLHVGLLVPSARLQPALELRRDD